MMITEKKLKIDPEPMPVTPYQPQTQQDATHNLPRRATQKPTPIKPIKPLAPKMPEAEPPAHMRIVEGQGLAIEQKQSHRRPLLGHRFRITLLPFYIVIALVIYTMSSGPALGLITHAQQKQHITQESAASLASIYEPLIWTAERTPPLRNLTLDYMAWWVDLFTTQNTNQITTR